MNLHGIWKPARNDKIKTENKKQNNHSKHGAHMFFGFNKGHSGMDLLPGKAFGLDLRVSNCSLILPELMQNSLTPWSNPSGK